MRLSGYNGFCRVGTRLIKPLMLGPGTTGPIQVLILISLSNSQRTVIGRRNMPTARLEKTTL